ACIKVDINASVTNNGSGNAAGATLQERIINSKVITGVINENVELPKGKYTLKGYVYVNNRAFIRFAPGSVIIGDTIQKGALIIEQNAKIFAEGTATEPIVFTSGKAPGQRKPGDWGGIAIAGNAPTNRTTTPILEGGINAVYGGPLANDNSGILKYVRIEFAGIAADPNSEINGLTLGGVGRGTIIENVQVSYGNDDAFEFFGGTVNCKNLIAFATADDDFDFDFGYVGSIQFGVSLRDPLFVDGGDAGNGIECDNDGAGSTATPRTRPVLSNFTFCGPNGATGTLNNHNFNTRFRRATHFVLINSILMGYQKGGFQFESDATAQSYIDGTSVFRNNLVHAIADTYRV
ncbi:MAG: T9SS C-terminal target domain-containing protein, partial [Bacteroidota bacterium]